MPIVYGVLYSSTLNSLIHVILCIYHHDQSGESIQCPCKTVFFVKTYIESVHNKTNKMTCVPSEDSNQFVHLPRLIRVFAGHTCHFVGYFMWRFI